MQLPNHKKKKRLHHGLRGKDLLRCFNETTQPVSSTILRTETNHATNTHMENQHIVPPSHSTEDTTSNFKRIN